MGTRLNSPAELAGSPGARKSSVLDGRRLLLARVGWLAVFVLTVGLFVASIPAQYEDLARFTEPGLNPEAVRANLAADGISVGFYAAYFMWVFVVSTMVWIAVSAVLFWRRSNDWMALFTSLSVLTFGVFFLSGSPVNMAQEYPVVWLPVSLMALFGSVSLGLLFFLFPDGRFVPRWAIFASAIWAAHEVAYYFFPNSAFNVERSLPLLNFAIISTLLCVGVGSQLYRYLRVSGPVQRQQTKWVVFGMVSAGIGVICFATPLRVYPALTQFGSPFTFVLETGVIAGMLLIPLSIGLAVLRHRLWDVDVVINRAIVYGLLSATLVCLYALVVGGLGALLRAPSNFLLSLLAAGLVAVLFAPLRERLQRSANRLMYGERDDPYAVLSGLGRRLEAAIEPDATLSTIVETVAGALKLPYVAITMKRGRGFEIVASHGASTGEEKTLPLSYGGEAVGTLLLAPRAPGEDFSPADRRLLEDLARNVEVAVHAVELTHDLKRSRERLVTAREEERRRLRRDLHDGLGPTLASLTLGLDVSLKLFRKDPPRAEEMLTRLKAQTKEAVVDIRRLVYGLRPPALDDLGLVAAIKEQAAAHGTLRENANGDGLGFGIEAPEELPPLPAAVEVACYRIAQEAITNVARHAGASYCLVRLSVDEDGNGLLLEVEDDGMGIPENPATGVGLSSMRERAGELGGSLSVTRGSRRGTLVSARFALFPEER